MVLSLQTQAVNTVNALLPRLHAEPDVGHCLDMLEDDEPETYQKLRQDLISLVEATLIEGALQPAGE